MILQVQASPTPCSQKSKQGFTLIELLVVIAIIGILAAILFPVFARAREQARKAACQSNLKQMGLAVAQYTQDYDETYPIGRFGEVGGAEGFSYWYTVIEPYVKNKQVFYCPTAGKIASSTGVQRGSGGYGWNIRGTGAGSTNTNGFGYWQDDWGTPQRNGPLKVAAVNEPATTIYIADPPSNNDTGVGAIYANAYSPSIGYMPVLHGGQVGPFYDTTKSANLPVAPGGGGNYLFADGHVKFLQASQTFCSNLWNVDKQRALAASTHGCGTLKP